MFDLSAIFGDHIDNMKPHAVQFAEETRGFAREVCDYLKRMTDALEETPFEEQRIYLSGSSGAVAHGPLGKNAGDDPITVPPGEEWLIESVMLSCGVNGQQFKITGALGQDATTTLTVGGVAPSALLWGGPTANGVTVLGGNGTIIPGNTRLYVATVQACDYKVQFKRKRLSISKPTTAGGMVSLHPTNVKTVEQTGTSRHTGTWAPNR